MFSRSFKPARRSRLPRLTQRNNISVVQRWWNSQSVDRGASIGLAAACVALGCSVAPPDYTADSDTGSTHVLITVDRRESSEEGSQPRASAFAGFVRTPPTLDQASVLKLAGLALDMPPVGQ